MSRGGAAVLDALILVLAGLVVQVGAACVRLLLTGPPFRLPELPGWLSGTVGWTAAVLYLGGSWSGLGCTPGGRLMGLRVGDRTGRPLGVRRSVARAALCVTFPLGLCWIPLSRRCASLQDLVVASAVFYDGR
ncbi:RDD family protein [Streptomyces sp. NBC_00648]|uniref:RDD family protein n=1 Tax=Streptomyces sp. NBC_00648 TaxID=2975797 RepID=UPI00324D2476